MRHQEARVILEGLVQGVHPETGATLRGESVLEDATVLRALLEAAAALRAAEGRALRQAFQQKRAPEEIARAHRRTVRAIAQRLQRMGLLGDDSPQWAVYSPHIARDGGPFGSR